MLTGWVCLYLFLVYVLTHGGKIQGWHTLIWVVATFVGTMLVQGWTGEKVEGGEGKTESEKRKAEKDGRKSVGGGRSSIVGGQTSEDGRQRVQDSSRRSVVSGDPSSGIWHPASGFWRGVGISAFLTCLAVILPVAFSWVLSHFTDFSWDGMTSRGITVRNLMTGDPALNAYPFGHVLAGFLAHVTGSWQGGKGINPTLIWIAFCFVFSALKFLNFSGWKLWFLSIVTALNPVAVYQISCFQIDGHVASLITCLIFSMVVILASPCMRGDAVLALAMAFTAGAACKTSGVFYAIIIDGIFLLFLAGLSRSWKRVVGMLFIAAAITWPLGVYIRSTGQFAPLSLEYLRTATGKGPGYGVGGGASEIKDLEEMDRIQQFLVSSCAYTEIMPTEVNLKPPFWMQRRELRAVEDLTPDPRAGGFGPLFSTGLLLAGLGCLTLVLGGRAMYWPGWFVFLATAGSSFGSQVWWARWTPQNWLLLIAMLMTVLAFGFKGGKVQRLKGEEPEGEKVQKFEGGKAGRREGANDAGKPGLKGLRVERWIGAMGWGGLACVAVGLNVFLVTLYYGIGMFRHERVLAKQMILAGKLTQPLGIYLPTMKEEHTAGISFQASKYWLQDRGFKLTPLPEAPPRPRMKLNRTDTTFALPPDWKQLLEDPRDQKLFKKYRVLEE